MKKILVLAVACLLMGATLGDGHRKGLSETFSGVGGTHVRAGPPPGPTFPIPDVVSYWRFEDDLIDSFDGGNDGTATGAAYATGKHNRAYSLFENFITLPNVPLPQMSFFCWVFKVSDFTNAGIATKSNLGGSQGDWALGFFSGSSNLLTARLNNNSITVIGQPVSNGAWHHLGFTYDQVQLEIWADGSRSGAGNFSTAITNGAGQEVIGTYYDTGHPVDGSLIDECVMFSRGLSAAEVTQLYGGGAGLFY